jgi:hypothetical protein
LNHEIINRNKWHYKFKDYLQLHYGGHPDWLYIGNYDICKYSWSVVGSIASVAGAIGTVSAMLTCLADSLIATSIWAITDLPIVPYFCEPTFMLGLAMYLLIYVTAIIVGGCYLWDAAHRNKKAVKAIDQISEFVDSSFMVEAYRAHKEQFCYKVK